MTVKLARRLLLIAGIYGVVVVAPLFFLENRLNQDFPPAITHPEWYYGFAWVALAWQLAYLIVASDPVRYRPLLLAGAVGKVGFAVSAMVLCARGRLDATNLVLPAVDLVLAGLFVWVFLAMGKHELAEHKKGPSPAGDGPV